MVIKKSEGQSMKGVMFTEFLDFVERTYGEDAVDLAIENSNLQSEGVYKSQELYDFREMIELVSNLTLLTHEPASHLLRCFGSSIVDNLIRFYPQYFRQGKTLFQFLDNFDQKINTEMKKLYPDVTLPNLEILESSNRHIIFNCYSSAAIGSLAEGLILGAARYYRADIAMNTTPVGEQPNACIRFEIFKKKA